MSGRYSAHRVAGTELAAGRTNGVYHLENLPSDEVPVASSPPWNSSLPPSSPLPELSSTPTPRTPQGPRQPAPHSSPEDESGIPRPFLPVITSTSDHILQSSPIRGRTKAERSANRQKKLAKQRRVAKDKRQEEAQAAKQAAVQLRAEQEEARHVALEHEGTVNKVCQIKQVLSFMKERDVTYGDLLLFMSDVDTSKGYGQERFSHFFANREMVTTVLKNWTSSSNSRTGRLIVQDWAIDHVSKLMNKEANKLTKTGILQSARKAVDRDFILNFDLQQLHRDLRQQCPTTNKVLDALASTNTRRKHFISANAHGVSDHRPLSVQNAQKRRDQLVGTAMLVLLRCRSQRNSLTGHILGLYLYSTGAQRQVISVLSHMGLCSSYQTIAGTRKSPYAPQTPPVTTVMQVLATETENSDSDDSDYVPTLDDLDPSSSAWEDWSADDVDSIDGEDSTDRDASPLSTNTHSAPSDTSPPSNPLQTSSQDGTTGLGLLRALSDDSRRSLRSRAQAPGADVDPLANIYDNINFMFRAAEQRLGRHDSQENGTCATAFSLFGASRSDMKTTDFVRSLQDAPPLTLSDILLTSQETDDIRERLIWTVMQIAVEHGGEAFTKFKSELTEARPSATAQIAVHKTEVFPMPAMHIDESSTVGNAEVLDTMFKEMGHDLNSPEFTDEVRVVFGDQLSMARVRAITNTRVGHDDAANAYLNVAFAPGFFHYQMATTHGVLETHWGDATSGARDPGSLRFHNTVLDRKPIVLSSLPPYRTCRDVIFVSLYARVLHCLELVSDCSTENYGTSKSFEDLRRDSTAIVDTYASASDVFRRRQESSSTGPGAADGGGAQDTVYENAVLFLRDALLLRHFANAVKRGASDHIVAVLKLWALGFRAMGRVKYAHELLHLIHNIIHLWPKELREIIMNNWLVNLTGHVDGFIPVDLLQEHLNYWIKVVYQAHGSNASWEWLETIAPCIDILRRLATQINANFGSHQGDKHSIPDLSRDIRELMRSLHVHSVYTPEVDRPGVEEVPPIANVFTTGLQALAGPLADYNTMFLRMKERRAMDPVVGKSALETYGISQNDSECSLTGAHGDDIMMSSPTPSETSSGDVSRWESSDDGLEGGLEAVEIGGGLDVPDIYAHDRFFSLDLAEDIDLDMDGY